MEKTRQRLTPGKGKEAWPRKSGHTVFHGADLSHRCRPNSTSADAGVTKSCDSAQNSGVGGGGGGGERGPDLCAAEAAPWAPSSKTGVPRRIQSPETERGRGDLGAGCWSAFEEISKQT